MWSSRQENRSKHLCHIYCKIKQWIHGDDKSHKLIKIVHICGRWMMECNTPFMNLSLLYLDNMRTWLYIFFSFIFFMDIDVSIFFGSCFLGMPSFLSLFLIAHASFEGYQRERSLNMEFYFVDGWNGIANFQCRSSAGGVHMILIK